MTQKTPWTATIAPIGERGATGQTIATDCAVTVHDGAPLIGTSGVPIGRVETAAIIDGHLVVTGTLDPGQELPTALPTFDVSEHPTDVVEEGPGAEAVTFHDMAIRAVRTDFTPVWPDPQIRFVRAWCVHVVGPDDLIPMPDRATAERAADRFNDW